MTRCDGQFCGGIVAHLGGCEICRGSGCGLFGDRFDEGLFLDGKGMRRRKCDERDAKKQRPRAHLPTALSPPLLSFAVKLHTSPTYHGALTILNEVYLLRKAFFAQSPRLCGMRLRPEDGGESAGLTIC
jgi:hypothetical protein